MDDQVLVRSELAEPSPELGRGSLEGLTVAMIGDIAHSRTARSNIWGLKKLGAHVIVCGPSTLVSPRWEELGVEYSYSLDAILDVIDVGTTRVGATATATILDDFKKLKESE